MLRLKDYYRLLGVPRDASPAMIKKAYRRLARQRHPDMGANGSCEGFHELQQAYETLINSERRRRYDKRLRASEPAAAPSRLAGPPAPGGANAFWETDSIGGEIVLTASEAALGGTLPLDVPLSMPCPCCDGEDFGFCAMCGGEGALEERVPIRVRIPAGVRSGTTLQIQLDRSLRVVLTLLVDIL
jgi:molecular chaperone DnaJ